MILVYDIECFKYDSFVIFKNLEGTVTKLFHDKNSFEGLGEFIQGHTLVGYNNYYYDDHVLNYMLMGRSQKQIKALNDRIIAGEKIRGNYPFKSLDCFQQIDVGFPSLKKIEGNRGVSIIESSVPFDIDRPLTKEEYKEVVEYCLHDVDQTIWVYNHRINSYFEPKQSLIDMVGGMGEKWNTTTLSANALLGKDRLVKWSDIGLTGKSVDPEGNEKMLSLVPEEVRDLWKNNNKGKVTVHDFNCSIEFGFGGLHGINTTRKRFKKVILLDVVSMYPNIILIINALGRASEKYRNVLSERTAVKHINKILSEALKLILNSVYGNLGNEYSSLHNPNAQKSVCIYGQIALYELGKRLSEVGEIVQLNTDGVAFIPHGEYKDIWDSGKKTLILN